jgi:putative restriction endonuclease
MKAYVGVTDSGWYRFLASRRLDEVNFWRPGGDRNFRALDRGDMFLFKTHAPHNKVVGGGFYSGFTSLRISDAWDEYAERNGVAGPEEMRERVNHYRRNKGLSAGDDPVVGCILLRDVRFFAQGFEVEPPAHFAPSIVQGKGYDLSDRQHRDYFKRLLGLLLGESVDFDLGLSLLVHGPVYGEPRLTPQRLGQQSFRMLVADAYERRCAVTGSCVLPVLEAAHIKPAHRERGCSRGLNPPVSSRDLAM